MKVAVVTPFHQTPEAWLEKCLASVAKQTVACTHFLVCDGDEPPPAAIAAGIQVLRLPQAHHDFGGVARAIGSVSAIGQGFDAIAYLDSDNWYEPDHVELLCAVHERTGAVVCSCGRTLYDLDGQLLGPCPEVDGDKFVDTNCLFLTRRAFGLVAAWYLMPRLEVEVGDRFVWQAIRDAKVKRAHHGRATVNYRTRHRAHYLHFGKEPPAGVKQIVVPGAGAARLEPMGQEAASAPIVHRAPRTISLCMIVRNEESKLANCLSSVADLVTEMIVVDTGSTDRTKEVAVQGGAKVFDFPWVDDFAAARNESLRHATGEWILWLDADECFDEENRQRLGRLLHTLGDENRVYLMKQWSVREQVSGSALVVDHARLFRKQPGVGWRYRVHEQVLPALQASGAKLVFTDIVFRHSGYQGPMLRKQKLERNLRLLLKDKEERPDDGFILFNLGATYLETGDVEKGVACLQRCLETSPRRATFLAKAYVLLAQVQRRLGRLEEGLGYCLKGKARFPKDVELLFEEGLLWRAKKDPAAAQKCFEEILKLPGRPSYVAVDATLRGELTRQQLELARREQGRRAEASATSSGVI